MSSAGLIRRTRRASRCGGRRHGRLILVGGEAGIGKTALVRTFADEHAQGARVLWGACDGLFTPQPLRPLLDISGELGLDADAPQRELFSATLDALRPGPTIAIFEDVHWADGATVDLLRFLGRRLDRTATLLIATYRDDELGAQHPLRVVLGDVEAARRIMLVPLTEHAVRALAGDSAVDPAELHRQTGGNPFFVSEVLAAGGMESRRACGTQFSRAPRDSGPPRAGCRHRGRDRHA